MTIVGIDVSSRRIDLAWISPLGAPCRWHQELAKGHLIDRLRSIHIQWPESPTDIAIEYPFAVQKPAVAALMAVVGVITHQAPTWTRVAWPSSGELRAAIGAANNKASAHFVLLLNAPELYGWDDHELDALVACLGWTSILEGQDA